MAPWSQSRKWAFDQHGLFLPKEVLFMGICLWLPSCTPPCPGVFEAAWVLDHCLSCAVLSLPKWCSDVLVSCCQAPGFPVIDLFFNQSFWALVWARGLHELPWLWILWVLSVRTDEVLCNCNLSFLTECWHFIHCLFQPACMFYFLAQATVNSIGSPFFKSFLGVFSYTLNSQISNLLQIL